MNTLSNLDTYFIPNTLDGINVIEENISDATGASLHIDGTNKMLADIDVNLHQIKNLDNGTAPNDAVNYSQLSAKADTAYVDSQDNLKLNLTGGTITGIINQIIGGNNIQYGGSNIIHATSNTVENVAIGYETLKEGGGNYCFNNTAIGNGALNNVYFASRYNTAIGHSAGYQAIGGDYNIYMGYQSGINSYNDEGCNYIGCFSGRDDPNPPAKIPYLKSMAIGAEVIVNGSNQIRIGTATETTIFDGSVVIQTPTVGNNPTTKTYVDNGLNLKADLTYVDSSLNLKANLTYVDSSLNLKSNISYVDSSLNLKLNKAGDTMTGVLTLNGGTVTKTTVDASNLTNTYINFAEAGATSDWAYLRQIGGSNDIKLSLDFHDDLNDGKFALRSIQSTATPDTINEFFYASPAETKINAPLNMLTHKILNVDTPTLNTDATNKLYVDTSLNTLKSYVDSSLNLKVNITDFNSTQSLYITANGSTTLTDSFPTYNTYNVDAGITYTIYLASSVSKGRFFYFKNVGSGVLNISTNYYSYLDLDINKTITLSTSVDFDAVSIQCYSTNLATYYGSHSKQLSGGYLSGQTIQTKCYNQATTPSIRLKTQFVDDTNTAWIAIYFTTKSANSTIILNVTANWYWEGYGTDALFLRVKENLTGTDVDKFTLKTFDVTNGGLRKAPIFPFCCNWTSTQAYERLIRIYIDTATDNLGNNNDTINIDGDYSITITEIQN